MSFVYWIPVIREHRPYDTHANVERVGGCHRCKSCFPVGQLHDYPKISENRVRTVCSACLDIDKRDGTFDAIMDIWDNYEEHRGLGHALTVKEFLEGRNEK